jgi:hypothetical protein
MKKIEKKILMDDFDELNSIIVNKLSDMSIMSNTGEFSEKELEEKVVKNFEIPKSNIYMNVNINDMNTNNNNFIPKNKLDYLQLKNLIHLRINFLVNLNYFIRNYTFDIGQIFNKIDSIIYRKITNLIERRKYYVKFFKDITNNFEKFAFTLEESSTSLNFHFRDDKQNLNAINKEITNTQKVFSKKIEEFNKNLFEKLQLKEVSKSDTLKYFNNKISDISKESFSILSELNKKKDKFVNSYNNYERIFESFKRNYNISDKLEGILETYDFFNIEIELSKIINKTFEISESFFLKYIYSLSQLKNICREFVKLILEMIQIYQSELKGFFNIFDNELTSITDDILNEYLSEKDIFFDSTELNDLEILFKNFQNNVIKFSFIKNDVIYFDQNFSIKKYKSFEEIVDFFISIIPEKINFEASNLCLFNAKFIKSENMFSKESQNILILSVQNNILIYNPKYSRKNLIRLNMKKTSMKKIDDKINPFKFQINEIKSGILFNSNLKFIFETKIPEDYVKLKEFFG